jgi:hypothetical protein
MPADTVRFQENDIISEPAPRGSRRALSDKIHMMHFFGELLDQLKSLA